MPSAAGPSLPTLSSQPCWVRGGGEDGSSAVPCMSCFLPFSFSLFASCKRAACWQPVWHVARLPHCSRCRGRRSRSRKLLCCTPRPLACASAPHTPPCCSAAGYLSAAGGVWAFPRGPHQAAGGASEGQARGAGSCSFGIADGGCAAWQGHEAEGACMQGPVSHVRRRPACTHPQAMSAAWTDACIKARAAVTCRAWLQRMPGGPAMAAALIHIAASTLARASACVLAACHTAALPHVLPNPPTAAPSRHWTSMAAARPLARRMPPAAGSDSTVCTSSGGGWLMQPAAGLVLLPSCC